MSITSITQKRVGKYKIYLYVPEISLAIEIDEYNHIHRNKLYENDREDYIKQKLKCSFLRIDPDDPNFNIFTLVGEISKIITKKQVKATKKNIEIIESAKPKAEKIKTWLTKYVIPLIRK